MTYVHGSARQEEGVALDQRTLRGERFQVEELADGHPPSGQQPLVKVPLRLRAGPDLEGPRVAAHRRQLPAPEELQQLFRGLDADVVRLLRLVQVVQVLALRVAHGRVLVDVPEADHENVPGPEVIDGHVLVLEGLHELLEGDFVRGHGIDLKPLGLCPGVPINQDGAPCDALSRDVWGTVALSVEEALKKSRRAGENERRTVDAVGLGRGRKILRRSTHEVELFHE